MDEKKKQAIEEMELVMHNSFGCRYFSTKEMILNNDRIFNREATALYNAGYRKESDTAREIIADAKKWVKEHHKDKVTDSFGEREMLFVEAFGYLFEYLKEKYEVNNG